LRRIPIQEKESKNDYLVVDDVKGLVSLAQMGALEVHLWGSTEKDLERPDRLVFDLDPAEDVPWARTVESARRVRERLKALGLESFVKTTGGKGLHVTAPIVPSLGWEAVKSFTKALALALSEAHPGEYVVKAGKALRAGKIFVDYLRNGRGATSVCPYSPRAKAGAPVSLPLSWTDLDSLTQPPSFSLESVADRLSGRTDPWKGFFSLRQKIPAEVRRALASSNPT
jgi:bifunctional non-homologous end joining protein LigD